MANCKTMRMMRPAKAQGALWPAAVRAASVSRTHGCSDNVCDVRKSLPARSPHMALRYHNLTKPAAKSQSRGAGKSRQRPPCEKSRSRMVTQKGPETGGGSRALLSLQTTATSLVCAPVGAVQATRWADRCRLFLSALDVALSKRSPISIFARASSAFFPVSPMDRPVFIASR